MSGEEATVSPDNPSAQAGWRGLVRSWRYFFWLLGGGLLIVFLYVEENWRGERAWESYKRSIAARGETIEPFAFVPPPVADTDNFTMTPLLAPLFEFMHGTQRWRDTNGLARLHGFAPRYDAAQRRAESTKRVFSNSWFRTCTDLRAWHAAMLRGTNITAEAAGESSLVTTNFSNEEAAIGVLEALSECAPAFVELRAASKRPYSRFNIRYDHEDPAGILLPHLAVVKHLCQVLQLRAEAYLALGKNEEAFEDVELMLYLVDATRVEPFIISHLVRIAEFQLALQPIAEGMGRWSEPQLRALQERIEQFNFCADLNRALRGERALFGTIVDFIQRSPEALDYLGSGSGSGPSFGPALVAVTPKGWFYFERINHARLFDECILPPIDPEKGVVKPGTTGKLAAEMSRRLSGSGPSLFLRHRLFASLMLPGLGKLSQKAAFAQAARDSGVLACALERYRLARGQFPESLQALQPDFIDTSPHDVVNGEPLRYRRTNNGRYLLYSVGWNERDDGGIVGSSKSPEAGAPLEGDWVWQPE